MNARELAARHEINLEAYIKTINVEGQVMVLMADRYILPAALRYQKDVAESVNAAAAAGASTKEAKKLLERLAGLIDSLRERTDALNAALNSAHAGSSAEHAEYMRSTVVPAMNALREAGDQIEVVVPHEQWPLPTYREMLFIK
jgi:glutamine synthetase